MDFSAFLLSFRPNCKNWSSRPTCLLSYFQHNRPNPKGIVQFQQKILFITFSFIVENWEGQFQKDIYWGLFAADIGTNIFLLFRSTNLFYFIPPSRTFGKLFILFNLSFFNFILLNHDDSSSYTLFSIHSTIFIVQTSWHELKGIIVKDTWTCFWKNKHKSENVLTNYSFSKFTQLAIVLLGCFSLYSDVSKV